MLANTLSSDGNYSNFYLLNISAVMCDIITDITFSSRKCYSPKVKPSYFTWYSLTQFHFKQNANDGKS